MSKQLQISLGFTADVSAAMKNLETLRTSLNQIAAMPMSPGQKLNNDIKIASQSAIELQNHLAQAMNMKTGNLDLSKFNASLKSSGQSLSTLTSNLLKAGVTGEKAFLATHSAIASANLQLKQSNTLASQFMTTLKNTAKWQLSSSLLHGVISGFTSAISYAKDLNTSLNNIQIVTGQSAEQMAEFAKSANKAAKELKTTTVAYSDAALIYYQQGLEGEAVKERADTTVKLANVTRESAETVSQWMTAVWNNFDDGSKSLEYYADVMTALGAATASSSDEIAQGLEKFAAVSETVGLSYEYATTALATITATTRQSADVVGTALKTLFARIQGLKLGETLEDGTTLNKYSEALASVGISIKDSAGGLKEMDVILNEMGAKWGTIGKDQQVALAQSVAGIRQYTQLIALMDNWDYFQQNLGVVENAEGTLEKQQEIYEQSWEAASKNVKASLEDLWSTLIPTDTIIDMTNGLAKVVDGFTDIIDAAGGLKTIMLFIANSVLTKFQANIAIALNSGISKAKDFGSSLKNLTQDFVKGFKTIKQQGLGTTVKQMGRNYLEKTVVNEEQMRQNNLNYRNAEQQENRKSLDDALTQKTVNGNDLPLSAGFVSQIKSLQQVEQYNTQILNLKDKMTLAEYEMLQAANNNIKILGEEKALSDQKLSDLREQLDILKQQQEYAFNPNGLIKQGNSLASLTDLQLNTNEQQAFLDASKAVTKNVDGVSTASVGGDGLQQTTFDDAVAAQGAQAESLSVVSSAVQTQAELEAINSSGVSTDEERLTLMKQRVQELVEAKTLTKDQGDFLVKDAKTTADIVNKSKDLVSGAKKYANHLGVSEENIANTEMTSRNLVKENQKNAELSGTIKNNTAALDKNIQNIIKRGAKFGDIFVKGVRGISQMAMGLSMVTSAFESVGNMMEEGKASFSGILGVVTSLTMGLPMLVAGFNMLTSAVATNNVMQGISSMLLKRKAFETSILDGINKGSIATEQIKNALIKSGIAAETAEVMVKEMANKKNKVGYLMSVLSAKAKAGETTATWAQVAANIAETASAWPKLVVTLLVVAALAALVAIIWLVVAGIQALCNWYNADAIAAEKANKALEEQKKVVEELKNKYNELKTSIQEITEAHEAIKTMTRGTQEWRDAIKEANDQVLELINTYPELTKYLKKEENGLLLTLNGEADDGTTYEDFLKEQEKSLNQAQTMQFARQIAANKANIKAQKTEMGRDAMNMNQTAAIVAGTGILVPLIGPLVSAGGTLVQAAEAVDNMAEEATYSEALNNITEWEGGYQDFFSVETEELEKRMLEVANGDQQVADALMQNKEEVMRLAQQEAALNETNKALIRQMSSVVNSNNETYAGMEVWQQAIVDEAASRKSEELTAQAQGKVDALSNEEAAKEYMRLTYGENWESNYKIKDTGGKGYTIQTKDDSGAWVNLNDNDNDAWAFTDARDALVQYYSAEMSNEDIERLDTISEAYYNNFDQAKGLSEEAKQALATSMTLGDSLDLSGLSEEDIEIIRNASFSSGEVRSAVNAGIQEYERTSTERNIQTSKKFNINEKTANELNDIFELTGENQETFDAYVDTLRDFHNIDIDDNGFTEALAKTNLAAQGSVEQLSEIVNEQQYYLDESKKGTIEYSKAIGDISNTLSTWFGQDIDQAFVSEHLDLIKRVSQGDLQAIEDLQKELALSMVEDFKAKGADLGQAYSGIVQAEVQVGQNMAQAGLQTYVNSINQMVQAGKITAEEAAQFLKTLGFEVLESAFDSDTNSFDANLINYVGRGKDIQIDTKQLQLNEIERKKQLQDLEKEKERYYEIDAILEDTEHELELISDAKDRAFGSNKIALMNQEMGLLENKLESVNYKLQEAEKFVEEDKKALSDLGVTFNSEGRITNYEETEAAFIKRLQAIGDTDSVDYQLIQSQYEAFKDGAERYRDNLTTLKDAQAEAIDLQNQLIDLEMERIQYTIELQVEFENDDIEFLDYLLSKIEDDAFSAAESLELLGQKTESVFNKIESYKTGIREAFSAKDADGKSFSEAEIDSILSGDMSVLEGRSLTEGQLEAINEFKSGLLESNEELLEIKKSMEEVLINSLEAWNEELDKGIGKIEHLGSVLESYRNIVDIVGKDILGISNDTLETMMDTQFQNAADGLSASKKALEANKSFLTNAQAELEKAQASGNEEDIEYWSKVVEEADAKVQEATENFQGNWENALQMAADAFSSSVENIAEEFSKSVSGIYDSLEEMQSAFERLQEVEERYLADYEKTYEISKLNRKIMESIDQSDNVAAQKELRDLQASLNKYKSGDVAMSKYDLEYLQKKYDLLVAEQALRDAQNAKSQVRLTRNSEGGFGYTYTADEKNIAEAESNFEQATYEMQNYFNTIEQELTNQWIQALNRYNEGVLDLQNKYGKDTAEFREGVIKLQQELEEDTGFVLGQLEIFADRANITFNETILGSMYTEYDSWEQLQAGVSQQVENTVTRLMDVYDDWRDRLDYAMDLAGTDTQEFASLVNQEMENVKSASEIAASGVDQMATDMTTDLNNLTKSVSQWRSDYCTEIGKVISKNEEMIKSINATRKIQGLPEYDTKTGEEIKPNPIPDTTAKPANNGGGQSATPPPKVEVEPTKPETTTPQKDPTKAYGDDLVVINTKADVGKEGMVKGSDGKWYRTVDTEFKTWDNVRKYWFFDTEASGFSIKKEQKIKMAQPGAFPEFGTVEFITANDEKVPVVTNNKKDTNNFANLAEVSWLLNGKITHASENGNVIVAIEQGQAGGAKEAIFSFGTFLNLLETGRISFDTGGYTGSWGPEGRMAMLHQKEIVLNAHDTENLLTVVGIVRSMVDQLEANTKLASYGLGQLTARTIGVSSDTLQQEVTIHAEFPNATDHNEIEEAFRNLTNLASQYANRK